MSIFSRIGKTVVIASDFVSKSTIAKIFLGLVCAIFILNLLKMIIIFVYARHQKEKKQCYFLNNENGNQKCSLDKYKEYFENNNFSCADCKGRHVNIPIDELKLRAAKTDRMSYWIFMLAKLGSLLLPYISVLFTIIIAAYISQAPQ